MLPLSVEQFNVEGKTKNEEVISKGEKAIKGQYINSKSYLEKSRTHLV